MVVESMLALVQAVIKAKGEYTNKNFSNSCKYLKIIIVENIYRN